MGKPNVSQALGMEEERKNLLLIRLFTVGTVYIGKCVLRAVKAAYHKIKGGIS
jgi:hypothetical protein